MFTEDDITVVICHWMTTRITLGAIHNLRKFYPNIKILVVDDGSIEDDRSLFSASYHYQAANDYYDNDPIRLENGIKEYNFEILHLDEHFGHGGAMDYGFRHVKTPLVLTMDNDIRLLKGGTIEAYLKDINEDPDHIFAVGTTWWEHELSIKWIGLWFSLFQVKPIVKNNLSFKDIVIPVGVTLGQNLGTTIFINLGCAVYNMLTFKYPHHKGNYKAVFYPHPEHQPDIMRHIKKPEKVGADQKIIDQWNEMVDG